MRTSLFAATSLAALALAPSAAAAPVAVSNTTELLAAIAAAKAGDEIVLAPGTYPISGSKVACSASGTQAAPIVVRSATPLAAKLELSTIEGFAVSGAHWHFEGLDIRGTCATDDACEHAFHVTGKAAGFVLRSSRVYDFNAQLKTNASAGGADVPHGGLVEGCELFDTRARQTSSPVTKLNIDTGDDWVVRANYIHDFHRASGTPSYGAFMKSGGKRGLFERNLVVCTKDDATPGTHIGLSFGGGGTGPQYCAPAFDASTPCSVEHTGGVMRNNVIANCSDVGIYINRGEDTKLLHNTLIATSGIDFRFDTTSGEARGNVLTGAIRDRNGATHEASDNLADVSLATFEAMYVAPLAGDLRKKGDLSALVGKLGPHAAVPDDYCARARDGAWDLGALQHTLGDCETVPPPLRGEPATDAGAPPGQDAGDGGSAPPGDGVSPGDPPGGGGGADDSAPSDGGCGCRATPASGGSSLALVGLIGLTALAVARRRR